MILSAVQYLRLFIAFSFLVSHVYGQGLYEFVRKIENPRGPVEGVDDQFGISLVQAGENLVVGSYRDDTGATDSGTAHIFSREGTLLATIVNPTPERDDWFGFEVRTVEDKIIIAARHDNTVGTDTGSIYLYDNDGNLLRTISNPSPSTGDGFGQRIAGVGDKILVSAWNDDTLESNSGVVYLLDQEGNVLHEYFSPFPHENGRFGRSIASIGDDRVIIGTYRGNASGDAGAAFVFDLQGNLLSTLSNPSPGDQDLFGGRLVDINGEYILMGAIEDATSGVAAGTSYLFNLEGTLIQTIPNPYPTREDWFGRTHIGIGNDRFVIGAPFEDEADHNSGAVYVYNTAGELHQRLLPPNPSVDGHFSIDVTTLDELLIVGSSFDGGRFMGAGAVYLYAPIEHLSGDYNNDGQVDQADLDLVLLNWGADGSTPPAGWTSNLPESLIDQDELDGVLLNWGSVHHVASQGASIPEHSSLALLIVCAIGAVLLRTHC